MVWKRCETHCVWELAGREGEELEVVVFDVGAAVNLGVDVDLGIAHELRYVHRNAIIHLAHWSRATMRQGAAGTSRAFSRYSTNLTVHRKQ